MKRRTYMACLLLSGLSPLPLAGQEISSTTFMVEPSDVAIPQGAELGKYRRIIQPFENWNLICDENLKTMKKVCNVTQSIIDQNRRLAFSWSLTVTQDGKPLMILRTRPGLGPNDPVSLTFPGRKTPTLVKIHGCDQSVCLAFLPVGPIMREQIGKASVVQIAYAAGPNGTLTFNAPLKGLPEALATIR